MIAICLGVGRSRRVKLTVSALAVAGVVCVAFLALYTGAHTFTDVIGGMFWAGRSARWEPRSWWLRPAAANRPRSVAARE